MRQGRARLQRRREVPHHQAEARREGGAELIFYKDSTATDTYRELVKSNKVLQTDRGRAVAIEEFLEKANGRAKGQKKKIEDERMKNMPKGGHKDDLAKLAKTDERNICGPRKKWKRKKAAQGYGAYGSEPWSIQSFEKRVYALRDFYKRELQGTKLEDPSSDPLVKRAHSRRSSAADRRRGRRRWRREP